MTRYAAEWFEAGACLSADPRLFFPAATGAAGARQVAKAQRICARCVVRRKCLEFALTNHERHGIWGGATPEERAQVARQRANARRRGRYREQAGAA
jgi:WhiB family transcriptional regulator, redox-sensing transcriptional regulator